MTCPACTAAQTSRYSGVYRAGCFGCEMRGYARSLLAFEAHRDRSTAELRAALLQSHALAEPEVALAEVWRWWRLDHLSEGATA